jgi:hypothetical protein
MKRIKALLSTLIGLLPALLMPAFLLLAFLILVLLHLYEQYYGSFYSIDVLHEKQHRTSVDLPARLGLATDRCQGIVASCPHAALVDRQRHRPRHC